MNSELASRLKCIAGKQTLVLTHYGRKSGKPYNVTIWFVVQGDKIFLSTANKNRQWVRNVQKTPRVGLAIGSESFAGDARFLSNPTEHKHAIGLVGRKYWMFMPVFAPWLILKAIGVLHDDTGAFEVTLVG